MTLSLFNDNGVFMSLEPTAPCSLGVNGPVFMLLIGVLR